MKNYYAILNVTKFANPEEIKKAYRKLAMDFHPDRNIGDATAEAKFKEITEAYEILSDSSKKANYDSGNYRRNFYQKPPSPPRPKQKPHQHTTTNNVDFDNFFGGSKFKGRHIQFRLEIEMHEAATGCYKAVTFKKRKRCYECDGKGFIPVILCPACQGTGFKLTPDAPFLVQSLCPECDGGAKTKLTCKKCEGQCFLPAEEKKVHVNIPKGIENGMSIRIANEGEDSTKTNGMPGDLIVVILIKEHVLFKREGQNLVINLPISYTQCVFGCKIDVPYLNGDKVSVTIPKGTQPNTKFRMKGKGLTEKGDYIINVCVEIPKEPDETYLKTLEELKVCEEKFVTPLRENWNKNNK